MFALTPLTGNIFDTVFTLSSTGYLENYLINWGDGEIISTSEDINSHVYSKKGVYNINISDCSALSSFTVSAFSNFFEDSIFVETDNLSAYTGCLNQFNINLSATDKISTINLYARNSASRPAISNDVSFWNHLSPEWAFYDVEGSAISSLHIEGVPVYSGTTVVGFTAISSVFFKDDMPGELDLLFTMSKNEFSAPINSRVLASLSYSSISAIPTKLNITSDGLQPLTSFQWSDIDIPYVITVGTNLDCSPIMHYVSGFLVDIKLVNGCYGISDTSYLSPIHSDGFPISCLSSNHFITKILHIPSSAIGDDVFSYSAIQCGENPDEQTKKRLRRSPLQMVLTATGVFDVNGTLYTLTGESAPFDVYRFENFYEFYRKGEDINIYDLIKQYSHFNFNELPMLDNYMKAIAGPGDTLGKMYDKIVNFQSDHADIDLCTIDSLYDITLKLDTDMIDFGLEFPEELKRFMNLSTIPLQKLVGIRGNGDGEVENKIQDNDIVSEGEIIAYREVGGEFFDFYESPTTTTLLNLTAFPYYDYRDKYCFYRWNNDADNVIDSIINYDDSRNKLNRSLIQSSEWYGDSGVLDETINYILTKNLLNN